MAYHGTMSLASTKRFNSATFSRSAWQIFTSQGDEVKIVVLGVLNLHVLPLPIPISIYSPTRLGGDPNIYCICVSWGTRTDYYSGKKSDTDWYENRASILASSEGLHDLFSNIRSQISFCWKWSISKIKLLLHHLPSHYTLYIELGQLFESGRFKRSMHFTFRSNKSGPITRWKQRYCSLQDLNSSNLHHSRIQFI